MGADLDVEPTAPLGDCGDLLRYRLRGGQLTPIDPKRPYGVVGHSYLAITCDVRGLDRLLRARLDAIEAHVWSGEQAAFDAAAFTNYLSTRPKRTREQTRILVGGGIFAALWLLVAILYIAGVFNV